MSARRGPTIRTRRAGGRPLVADPHTIRGGRMIPYEDLAAWMLVGAGTERWVRQAVLVAAG